MLGILGKRSDIPAIGLSIGLDRVIVILENKGKQVKLPSSSVFVASVGKGMSYFRLKLMLELRERGIESEMLYSSNPKMGSQFNKVFEKDSVKIPYMLIIGENEIKGNTIKVKIMESHKEIEMQRDEAIDFLVGNILS